MAIIGDPLLIWNLEQLKIWLCQKKNWLPSSWIVGIAINILVIHRSKMPHLDGRFENAQMSGSLQNISTASTLALPNWVDKDEWSETWALSPGKNESNSSKQERDATFSHWNPRTQHLILFPLYLVSSDLFFQVKPEKNTGDQVIQNQFQVWKAAMDIPCKKSVWGLGLLES